VYSRKCLLYWLRWHLVVKTSSLTVKKPKSASWYYSLRMWRHIGIWHWSWLSEPNNYVNAPASGVRIQNTVNTGHSSQQRMNGPLSSTSWKFWGHFDTGPCGCQSGIGSYCIMLSQCTMTCSIIWMALCELQWRWRLLGRKTYTSLWS